MMAFGLVCLVLLALGCLLLLMPALRRRDPVAGVTRDALNGVLYQRRLLELAQDEAQGVVADRARHIEELQHNLLDDIPITARPPARAAKSPPWAMAAGAVALVVVTLGLYAWTGGARQVWQWQRTVAEMPLLRARIMDPDAKQLSTAELARFAVGLRATLRREPQNTRDWLILGRIGVVLDDAAMAIQAFERAYRLAPDDVAVALAYAEALTRSTDAGDNQQGVELLTALATRQPDNLTALNLLAVGEYQQNNFAQALTHWRHILTLLPVVDPRADGIRRAIAQAEEQSGLDKVTLSVDVALSPAAAAHVPARGRVVISVTDGKSPVPLAVKTLPLSRFPLSLSLDDGDAMVPERLLSAQHQVKVRVRITEDGSAEAQRGDWFGESPLQDFTGSGRAAVRIDQQMP